jgi:tRNA (guanine37-N1)-methyltransferase
LLRFCIVGDSLGYKELIKRILGDDAITGYDRVGDIAIIEIPKLKKGLERELAESIMEEHKMIKTVITKAGPVSGKYRIRKLRYVYGDKNFVATYRENNCTFKLDLRKSFFSARLSFERGRIAALSKKKENVIVMFAGVGPFAIEIAKANKEASIVGIELNPDAVKWMEYNIKLNKSTNVTAERGDVKKFTKKYANYADRIVMPLPMSSLDFLADAIKMSKKRATIHIYVIDNLEDNAANSIEKITGIALKCGSTAKVVGIREARPYSYSTAEFAIDLDIKKEK